MTRKEMVPADSPGLCGPEWRLLCYIRRELRSLRIRTKKTHTFLQIKKILNVMNQTFSDWPEDPK